jgi:hypothetical protein
MTDDKWVGKFADVGVDKIPEHQILASRSSGNGIRKYKGRSVKVDIEKERHERAFDDTTGRTGRVERALKLWRAGMVSHMPEAQDESGHNVEDVWEVKSQTNKAQSYIVFEGICMCEDKDHNGGQDCKHELAVSMNKGDEIDGIKHTL